MAFLSVSRFAFHSSLSWIFSIFAVFRSIHVLQLSRCEGILHNNPRSYLLLLLYFFPVSLEFLRQHFCIAVHPHLYPSPNPKKETAFTTMFHFSCIRKTPSPEKPEWTSVNQTVLLPLRPALQPFPIRESKITIFTASAAEPSTKQDE